MATDLPAPGLEKCERSGVSFYTDEDLFRATGVRIAFTCSEGGFSVGPFEGLNLGAHVGDDPEAVGRNRSYVLEALDAPADIRLVTLDQVHGSDFLLVREDMSSDAGGSVEIRQRFMAPPEAQADALIIGKDARNVAGMLFFADCVPVIAVAPDGNFAIVHSGWRGVIARNGAKAVNELVQISEGCAAKDLNIYIGPCIRRECFEVDDGLRERFVAEFGQSVGFGDRNVDLPSAIIQTMTDIGADPVRICDLGRCTVCNNREFFSYRFSGGECGRHAAVAFRNI